MLFQTTNGFNILSLGDINGKEMSITNSYVW